MHDPLHNAERRSDETVMPQGREEGKDIDGWSAALILEKLLTGTVVNIQTITDDEGKAFILHRTNGEPDVCVIQRGEAVMIQGLTQSTMRLLLERIAAFNHDDE